jgi:hypothetical protein
MVSRIELTKIANQLGNHTPNKLKARLLATEIWSAVAIPIYRERHRFGLIASVSRGSFDPKRRRRPDKSGLCRRTPNAGDRRTANQNLTRE